MAKLRFSLCGGYCILLSVFMYNPSNAQQTPIVTDPAITVSPFMEVNPLAVRVAKCHADGHLYYITFDGGVYRIDEVTGQTPTDTLIASVPDHGINYLQGLAISDSLMFLSGNFKLSGTSGRGIVCRGTLQPNGVWIWETLMTTEPYPSTATLFDHAFSGICVTPGKDSIIVCSGSRTDHGEVQTSNGLYPGHREAPLTTAVFKLPASASELLLVNDSAWIDTSGYLFARGVRNSFDLAYDKNGNLFGVENSGDRDDSDELNWLREGHHYGFPWVMGGNLTGQQFATYDPALDLLINHQSLAWTNNYFYNDPGYPVAPAGQVFTPGVKNVGPHADMWRNPIDGTIINISDSASLEIRTFTTHKSPLGLTFDATESMDGVYTGSGFVLGYTKGCSDSSGFISGYGMGPFLDEGEDLLHLVMQYDSLDDNFNAQVFRIAVGFNNPVDAELDDNIMYVIENSYPGSPLIPTLWKLEFPPNTTSTGQVLLQNKFLVYPNPSYGSITIQGSQRGDVVTLFDLAGKTLQSFTIDTELNNIKANTTTTVPGMYFLNVSRSGHTVYTEKIIILSN